MPRRVNWQRVAAAAAVAALIALRKQDSLLHPQFWAEDGQIYFVQASVHSWKSLFLPYAGYLVLVPRLIAALATGLPVLAMNGGQAGLFISSASTCTAAWAPAFYAWASLALAGLVAWLMLSPRVRLPAAWAAAAALALVPHTGEVYLNIANVQWILTLSLVVLAVSEDPTPGACRWGEAAWLTLVGLTGPYIILASPLFAWRLWRRRSRWSAVLAALTLACSAVQAILLFSNPGPPAPPGLSIGHDAAVAGFRLFLLGASFAPRNETLCAGLAFGAALLLGWGCLRRRRACPDAWLLLAMTILLLAAGFYRSMAMGWDLGLTSEGDRYFFAEKVLVIWLVAILAQAAGAACRRLALAAALVGLLAGSSRFVYPPAPDLDWPHYAERIQQGLPTIAPTLPIGWHLSYPGRPRPGAAR